MKGITSIDSVALLNLEGAGMIGVPGTAHRLFGALRDEGISVILISQGSSEHSICFAVPEAEAPRAEQVVRRAFSTELREGQIQSIEVSRGCAILAVVGDGMAGTPGVSAKVFGALGKAAVNVRAIAQGASERNISVVIDGRDATRALRAVHASFYLSPHTLSIGVIGPGTVGARAARPAGLAGGAPAARLQRSTCGCAASPARKRMVLAEREVDLAHWRDALEPSAEPTDLDALRRPRARRAPAARGDHRLHRRRRGRRSATPTGWPQASTSSRPTRRPTARPMAYYRALREAARRTGGSHYPLRGDRRRRACR